MIIIIMNKKYIWSFIDLFCLLHMLFSRKVSAILLNCHIDCSAQTLIDCHNKVMY